MNTKLNAVKRMLDKAEDRYVDKHPITEALQRQYNNLEKARDKQAETALT